MALLALPFPLQPCRLGLLSLGWSRTILCSSQQGSVPIRSHWSLLCAAVPALSPPTVVVETTICTVPISVSALGSFPFPLRVVVGSSFALSFIPFPMAFAFAFSFCGIPWLLLHPFFTTAPAIQILLLVEAEVAAIFEASTLPIGLPPALLLVRSFVIEVDVPFLYMPSPLLTIMKSTMLRRAHLSRARPLRRRRAGNQRRRMVA